MNLDDAIVDIQLHHEKIVHTRKDRKCFVCNRIIPSGTSCKRTVEKCEGQFCRVYEHEDIRTCIGNVS